MWKVPVTIPGFGSVNYPNVCPLSPKRGFAFCNTHCAKAHHLGYPTGLKEFYKHCGISSTNIQTGMPLLQMLSAFFLNIVVVDDNDGLLKGYCV